MYFSGVGAVGAFSANICSGGKTDLPEQNNIYGTSERSRDRCCFGSSVYSDSLPAEDNSKPEDKVVSDNKFTEPGKKTERAEQPAEKPKEKTLAEMVREQMEKIDSMFKETEYDKSRDGQLLGIKSKMYRGLRLSPSEQQYLAAKDPDEYSKFQEMESARRMFKCTLNSCRTRDEVNSMRLSNALTALAEYRKAVRNGGDGQAIAALNSSLDREIRDYMRTASYQSLPTAAECNKFDRELAKAKRYECEKRREEMKARNDRHYKKKYKTVGDGKRTVAQVLTSPLARKVLASRRKPSVCTCDHSFSLNYKA